ncbi:MAG: hypothetical protein IJ064_07540 [Bacteroidaceae bacterium]|nr:hypothetical protein [Bacteroidaceae bacterium]
MKTKIFRFANRMVVAMLTCMFTIGLTSCGDDEPSVDELLSEETTPITFNLGKKGTHFLFDYAGNNYVGADTIEVENAAQTSQTITLRQGRHRLVWLSGAALGDGNKVGYIYYNPEKRTICCRSTDSSFSTDISVASSEVVVTPYLMPVQKVEYQSLCYCIAFSATDYGATGMNETSYAHIHGLPQIQEMSIEGAAYITNASTGIFSFRPFNGTMERKRVSAFFLCPNNGIDNIQLTCEANDWKGNPVSTSQFPKISVRRGYITHITGPLIGGSTGDFVVTMEPIGN